MIQIISLYSNLSLAQAHIWIDSMVICANLKFNYFKNSTALHNLCTGLEHNITADGCRNILY